MALLFVFALLVELQSTVEVGADRWLIVSQHTELRLVTDKGSLT